MPIPLPRRLLPKLILAIGVTVVSAPIFAQSPGNAPAGPGQPPRADQPAFGRPPPPPDGRPPPNRPPPPPGQPGPGDSAQTSVNPAMGLPPPPPPPPMPLQPTTATATETPAAIATPAETATQAVPDDADNQLRDARQGNDPESIGAALLNLADVRMHQSKPRVALPALEEAIAIANSSGNDRLGREASMAMAAAYDMLGDTAMGDTWRAHADEYRERMANRVAPAQTTPDATAGAPATIATTQPRSSMSSAAAAGAKSVSEHWPWWLALLCLLLFGAWWHSSRRAARLHDQTETLARRQRFLQTAHQSLKSQTEQFRQMAVQDSLTGTMNRQAFAGGLDTLLQHAAPFGKPVALFVFDLDHFKVINDRHGHLAGDAALKLVVGVVREKLQSEDLFGRFGGDEFLIACFGLDRERSLQLGESIRAAVVERAKGETLAPMPELSISMGIAHASPDNGYEREGLFARADTALYAAKRAGRNRVVLEDASLPPPPQDQPALRSLAPAPHEV